MGIFDAREAASRLSRRVVKAAGRGVGTTADGSRPAGRIALAILAGAVGVLAVHHPMILSGFGRIQTDTGDPRLVNYFLEHGWLWVSRAPGHERFWNAPFFHPVPDVMAFSDCMLAFGPLYWPFRAFGLAPEAAFGAWMVTTTALNYAAGVLLFRRGLGFGAPATAAAAGLIAFGSPRVNQLHHAQLLPTFFLLLALHALCRIARDRDGPGARARWWTWFALTVVAQLYGAFYLGWFLGVGLAVATVAALGFRSTRGRVVALARRDWWAAALAATVAAVALLPFFAHYLPAARQFGAGFSDFQKFVRPIAWSWWNVGEANWWWGWIDRRWPVGTLFPADFRLGVGFATSAACALGFHLGRRDPLCRVALATTLFAVAALTISLASIGAATACLNLAGILREPEWTRWDAASFGLATVALLAAPAEGFALSLSLATMAFCMFRIWNRRGRKGGWAAPGAALAALGVHSLPLDSAAILLGPFAAAGAVATVAGSRFAARGSRLAARGSRLAPVEAAIWTLGLWLAATAWMAVETSPWIPRLAAPGVAVGWWAAGSRRFRLGPFGRSTALGVALPFVVASFGADTLWLVVSPLVPGSEAIRVPPRAALALLVPMALGLAFLIERLDRGRWRVAAWSLVLICLAEQTQTTAAFDREANRRRIAAVARRVDRRALAFYARPPDPVDYYRAHLDAMWAALETGVPTVNGISGSFPAGWKPLESPGPRDAERALRDWRDRHDLRPDDVQLIDR